MPRLTYANRSLERSIAAFRSFRPGEEEQRRAAIAALPSKHWRGVEVFRVTCNGDFGRGPHTVWIPEYVLWGLIDVAAFTCPYHR